LAVVRARAAAVVVGSSLALGGCLGGGAAGGGDFEGREERVAEAIETLQSTATRQENAGDICRDLLSRALAARLSSGGTRCEQEIRHAIADSDLFDLRIVDVGVQGTNAQARVETSAGGETTAVSLLLIEEQGDWRLDGIRAAEG
jgi:hypothetical protein